MTEETMKSLSEMVEKAIEKVDFAGVAKGIVDAALEEKGLGAMHKKIFGASEDVKDLAGAEKSARFVKALFAKDREVLSALSSKAMTEGTAADGGFLVPDEFRSEIIRLVEDFGIIRKLARVIPMKRDTLNLPKVTASVTVSWPGEATAGTASIPTLAQVQLLAKTLVGLTPLSNELLEDADTDTVALLVELFAEAIAGEEDNQGLVGTGSPFTGVIAASGTTLVTMAAGKDTFAEADLDDYRDLISQVKATVLSGSAFFMHRSVWGLVQKLKENSQHVGAFQNPIVTTVAPQGVGIAGYLWGYPVYLSDKMPSTTAVSTKFVIFGNLKFLYLGDRKQITMSVSQDATVGGVSLFEANMSAVRVTERVGITVGLASAFAILKTASA